MPLLWWASPHKAHLQGGSCAFRVVAPSSSDYLEAPNWAYAINDRGTSSVRGFCHAWAVSSPNLDLVRSIYADSERGDWSSVSWAHPEIEYVMVDEPGSGIHRGHAAMGEAWRSLLSAWVDYRLKPQDYRTLDDERVLVLVRAYGRGKTSDIELAESTHGRGGANLFRIREGMVVRLDAYFDRDRALADLGLEE